MPEKKAGQKAKSASRSGKKAAGKKAGKKREAPPKTKVSPNASRAFLVINPVAGNGAALRMWEGLQETLRDLGLHFDYRFSEHPGHAMELSRDAARDKFGMVVVVGGDGTIYEVTNGLMEAGRRSRPAVGVIPCGRGSDFCRTIGIPQEWQTAASLVMSGRRRKIDLGRMEYVAPGGTRTAYFANIAGLGFDGEVTERANNIPETISKAMGGIGTYLFSLVVTYARFKEKDVMLQLDDREIRVIATSVVVANCQYFGGNMRIAPDAEPDDGLFDVVVLGAGFGPPEIEVPAGQVPPEHNRLQRSLAKARMASNVPRVYKGTHIEDESVMVARARKVKVTSGDRMVLQADGEVIGVGPMSAEIVPGALDFIA